MQTTTIDRTIQPDPRPIKEVGLPKYELITLDNGIDVYVVDAGEADYLRMEIVMSAAKWQAPQALVSEMACRMLKGGTQYRTATQLVNELDYYGASLGITPGSDHSSLKLYCLGKYFGNILPIVREVLEDSTFPDDELELRKKRMIQKQRIEMEKDDYIASRKFREVLFGANHPYGSSVELHHYDELQGSLLKDFASQYFTPRNMTIFMAGKVTKEQLQLLNSHLGKGQWGDPTAAPKKEYTIEPATELSYIDDKEKSVQSSIRIGRRLFNKTHPDFNQFSIVNTLLGGYFGARLMSNIREDKGYTYGIYSSLASFQHAGYLYITTEVGKQVRDATLKEISYEIERLKNEDVGTDELEEVRNYLMGKIMASLDGPFGIANVLKGLVIYNLETSQITEMADTILSITKDDVREYANKYLDYEGMYKVVVG